MIKINRIKKRIEYGNHLEPSMTGQPPCVVDSCNSRFGCKLYQNTAFLLPGITLRLSAGKAVEPPSTGASIYIQRYRIQTLTNEYKRERERERIKI